MGPGLEIWNLNSTIQWDTYGTRDLVSTTKSVSSHLASNIQTLKQLVNCDEFDEIMNLRYVYIKDSCTVQQKSTLSVEERNLFSIPMDTELVISSIQT